MTQLPLTNERILDTIVVTLTIITCISLGWHCALLETSLLLKWPAICALKLKNYWVVRTLTYGKR